MCNINFFWLKTTFSPANGLSFLWKSTCYFNCRIDPTPRSRWVFDLSHIVHLAFVSYLPKYPISVHSEHDRIVLPCSLWLSGAMWPVLVNEYWEMSFCHFQAKYVTASLCVSNALFLLPWQQQNMITLQIKSGREMTKRQPVFDESGFYYHVIN